MEMLLKQFIEFSDNERRLSKNTLESYARDVMQFSKYVDGKLTEVDDKIVLAYIVNMKKVGKALSTISRSLASLRSFYQFLYRSGKISTDPTANLQPPKVEKKLPQILTTEEVERLLEQPKCVDFKGWRDRAMLELLYATGIRVSELINADMENLNLRRSFLTCISNGKVRTIPLGSAAKTALGDYIKNARPNMLRDAHETALFVNYGGSRMTRQGFWKIIKQYKETAKIDKEITPHMLRHSFAAHLLENGADLVSIQELMGLADIASTSVYTKIMQNKIVDVYEKAHPRA